MVAEVTIGDLVTQAGHCFWVIPPDALFTPKGETTDARRDGRGQHAVPRTRRTAGDARTS